MKTRVAINGLGRIGRAFVRAAYNNPDIEIVAVNDLGSLDNLVYLLTYDSVYRQAPFSVAAKDGKLVIDGREVAFLSEREPSQLPWGAMQVDVVVESTGVFDSYEKSQAHITAGAKRVVITAPVKDEATNGATVLVGLNEDKLQTCTISSNASCTTNSASPLIAILDEGLGIEKALLNTVHSYTATQSLVDSPAKGDMRRGRAAAQNITPSSTGAAVAVTKAYTNLDGKFDGIAIRVPTISGSLVDVTFVAKRDTTAEEVNALLQAAAKSPRWQGIFAATEEELVSSDIVGSVYASIADLHMTRVTGGNLVKVLAWYDNEMGYAHTLVRHVQASGKHVTA